ncbi:MAG: exopolysaccharide biosynthesis polyprenyl glycosylphosphotransferase [Candidatus Magasanikbacteria bacterium]
MKFWHRLKQSILLGGDLVLFFLALWLGLVLRNLEFKNARQLHENLSVFVVIFLIWIMVNYINGLYDFKKISQKKIISNFVQSAIASFLISITILYIFPDKNTTPKTILLLTTIIAYLLIFVWRKIYINIISNNKLHANVLFLDYNQEIQEIIEILQTQTTLGYNVKAIVDLENQIINKTEYNNIAIYKTKEKLEKIVAENKIEIIVTPNNLDNEEILSQELYQLLFQQIKIISISNFYESVTGRIPPSAFHKTWFLQYLSDLDKPIYNKFTKLLEFIFIIIFSLFFLVFLPFISLSIKFNSKGKIFFKQKRSGQNGKIFWMYKFRTMYSLAKDGSAEIHGAQFAQKNDDRITGVGKFLRQTRLDELPQIINLLKGEITVIGPRPERPEISDDLQNRMPYYNLRYVIKPGITGWAQVQQHYTSTLETSLQKFQYDLFYIKNRSMLLDVSILLKTVNVILKAMGQ